MSWLSLRTLHAWLVLIVLGALAISQGISYAVLTSQQTILRMSLHEAEAFRRTAGIVKLAHGASIAELNNIATIASGPAFQVRFATAPAVEADLADEELSQALVEGLDNADVKAARVAWSPMPLQNNHIVTIHRTMHLPSVRPLLPTPPVPPVPPVAPPAPAAPHATSETPSSEAEAPEAPDPPEAAHDANDTSEINETTDTTEEDIPEPFVVQVTSRARRLDMAIELKSGVWLNVATSPPAAASFTWPLVLAGGSAALLVALAAI